MYELTFLKEIEESNKQPLNQMAKQTLEEAKVQTWPESLYVLQLAAWGLSQGLAPEKPSRPVLESVIQSLEESDPQKALGYLLRSDQDDSESPWELDEASLSGTPEDAAGNVLMTLAQRILEDPVLMKLHLV